MEKFDSNIKINWWGPKPIKGIPSQLQSFKEFE